MRREKKKAIKLALGISFAAVFMTILVSLALVVWMISALLPALFENVDKRVYPLKYEEEISAASEEFSVPEEIICAVIYTESSFNKDATSSAGARGLMQIVPDTFDDIQKALGTSYTYDDLYDPGINIRAGTYYLSYLYGLLGDWELVHAAYNAGIGRVWGWLENEEYAKDGKLVKIPYSETENYVKKIENAKIKYRELYFSK